jgi:hypothetical protein
VKATVLGHARSHLIRQLQKFEHREAQTLCVGGNLIMMEVVDGAIHVTVQKDCKGPF